MSINLYLDPLELIDYIASCCSLAKNDHLGIHEKKRFQCFTLSKILLTKHIERTFRFILILACLVKKDVLGCFYGFTLLLLEVIP